MLLPKDIQIAILQYLEKSYSCSPPASVETDLLELCDNDKTRLNATIVYFAEAKLIKDNCVSRAIGLREPVICYGLLKLTPEGAQAALGEDKLVTLQNYATVRLHSELLALLEARLDASGQDAGYKRQMLDKLRQMPVRSLEKLLEKLMDSGLASLPNVFELIHKLVSP